MLTTHNQAGDVLISPRVAENRISFTGRLTPAVRQVASVWNLFANHRAVCIESGTASTEPKPVALLPGSFNPLHHGHTELARAAAKHLGAEVHFELSVANADKPELPQVEVERRVAQFVGIGAVWVTRAATFAAKADLFPGTGFVLGWDTAVRVIDPKYYGGERERDAALRKLLACGCRLIVGGRIDAAGAFRVWESSELADEFAGLFVALAEADFRVDVSSTELRRN